MKISPIDLFAQLERLGASFPWERVELQLERAPAGAVTFTAYVSSDNNKNLEYIFGRGGSPKDAVDDAIKQAAAKGSREPESLRSKRLAQLREAIKKLEEAVIPTMPPFVPNRELTNGTLTVPDPVVNI